jgi:nitrogenase subunit NifH
MMIDHRLQMTATVLSTLEDLSKSLGIAVLHSIRTDTAVAKSGRERQFLADFDPQSKALEDYALVADFLLAQQWANLSTPISNAQPAPAAS